MRGCYIYASRITSAFSVALSTLPRAYPVYCKHEEDRRHLAQLLYNDFHPIPTNVAPRHVRETFALARGFVPSTSLVSPLASSSRSFSSFHGSAHQFVRDVHEGDVIVFFYKPACGPCAVIRDKIKTATGNFAASLSERSSPERVTATSAAGDAGSSSSSSNHRIVFQSISSQPGTGWLNEGVDDEAAASTMTAEDRAMCAQLRSHLTSSSAAGAGSHDGSPRQIRFLAVDTNENDRLTALHDVRSLPTFVAYHNGKIVGRAEGAHEAELLTLVKALKQAAVSSQTAVAGGPP